MSAEEIKGVIEEALVASEGGEKAAPLGIEADYGGAQDVLLMTGMAFERVAAKLNQGGAKGEDGTKYLFMTDAQLKQFDAVRTCVGAWVGRCGKRAGPVSDWLGGRGGVPWQCLPRPVFVSERRIEDGRQLMRIVSFIIINPIPNPPPFFKKQDCNNLVTDIEAHFNEAMKPIDAKIDHWEKEFKVWETDVTKYTDMLGDIPEGLDTDDFLKAFPGYEAYQDTWKE